MILQSSIALMIAIIVNDIASGEDCPFETRCNCQPIKPPKSNVYQSVSCSFGGAELPKFTGDPHSLQISGTFELSKFTGTISQETFGVFDSIDRLTLQQTGVADPVVTWTENAFENVKIRELIAVEMSGMFPIPATIKSHLGASLIRLEITGGVPEDPPIPITPETFDGLVALKILRLINIPLRVESATYSENAIDKLALINSKLTLFPADSLGACTQLTELDLSENEKMTFPNAPFSKSKRLQSLSLAGIDLSTANHQTLFEGVPELENLNLANTKLKQIPRLGLAQLEKLQNLVLTKNSIELITADDFPSKNSLKEISFENNLISEIDCVAFSNLKSVTAMSFGDNPLMTFDLSLLNGMQSLERLKFDFCKELVLTIVDDKQVPTGLQSISAADVPAISLDNSFGDYMAKNEHFYLIIISSKVTCTPELSWMIPYALCSNRIENAKTRCDNEDKTLKDYLQSITTGSCSETTGSIEPSKPTDDPRTDKPDKPTDPCHHGGGSAKTWSAPILTGIPFVIMMQKVIIDY